MRHTYQAFSAKFRSFSLLGMGLVTAVSMAFSAYGSQPVMAAACAANCVASMSASPSSGTYNPGATITVSVVVNSGGQAINAIQSDFTYTSSRLQYVANSANGVNGWTTYVSNVSGGSGSVVVGRTSGAATSGTVITMQFTVLSSAGAASVSFGTSSEVNKSDGTGDNVLGSRSGASYTVDIPAAAPPPPPASNPTPSTPPSSGGTGATPKPTTPSSSTPTPTGQPAPDAQNPTAAPTTDETKTNTGTPVKATDAKTTTQKSNPLVTAAWIAGGVVAVGAAGAGGWWLLRRRAGIVLPKTGGTVPNDSFITGRTTPPITSINHGNGAPLGHHDDTNPPHHL